ncbi:MAG: class I SAM-dependent RNA methyltransferase [Aquificota bacterium]|jgi:23S rRNA (uracil1939-C5)-methyltransferase|nr:class I SAM-dependent RNA methyltransferase [Aquificaceae bacterium]MDM7266655.1 class I SAM-dependent RNA methyltransferase [Aquificaceae bacterium]QWK13142.1 MAG: class I SAM-dependent RNA methyltransferase [Aquificota bacterium]
MRLLHDVHIEKLIYGGYGLSHVEGKSLMVDYALPGERVDVEILKEKKDYMLGRAKRVLVASPERREAPCKYYGLCGGCQLQHMDYLAQVRAKENMLLETIERIGKINIDSLGPSLYSEEFGYRVKAQLKVENSSVGFYERQSHNLVEIDQCLLLHPLINDLIPSLKELARKMQGLREIHVVCSPTEEELVLKLISEEIIPKEKLRKLMENILPKKVVGLGLYKDGKIYSLGRDFIFVKVGPYRYRVSMDSFVQVNYKLWEKFIEYAVPTDSFDRVLELHCGIGFFSLFLAQRSNFLMAYDSNPSAIRDAEYNAKINSISNATFGLEKGLSALKRHAGDIIDLIFLDPPRAGLSEGEAQLILKNKPKSLVYVSCEPTTLARDLKVLVKGGYKITKLHMIDNFPNTYHIEAIAHLIME